MPIDFDKPCARCGGDHPLIKCGGVKAVDFKDGLPGVISRVEFMTPVDFPPQRMPPSVETGSEPAYPTKGSQHVRTKD